MSALLQLSWRYIRFHRWKSIVLVGAMSITFLLPVVVSTLAARYEQWLNVRADATPIVIGMPGNRFDLMLRALYFRPGKTGSVPHSLVQATEESGLAQAVPLHIRYTARDFPVVGTTLDYFSLRQLGLGQGRPFAILGEAVLGSEVADTLELNPGDVLYTDQDNVFDLAKSFPLKLQVSGILAWTGMADDQAVFVDIRTAWIIEGLGHGHMDLTEAAAASDFVLEQREDSLIANAALPTYVEITAENIDSFHFHGSMAKLPVSAIIANPVDQRSATLLMTRMNSEGEYQAIVPSTVAQEMMAMVFRIKRFFDANFLLVSSAVLLLLGLVLWLSHRLRRDEFETINRLGGSRSTVVLLQAAELGILLAGASLIIGLGTLLIRLVPAAWLNSLW